MSYRVIASKAKLTGLAMLIGLACRAQTNLNMYASGLANGFQDWSWGSHNLFNTSPVYGANTYSVSFNDAAWNAISFWHAEFNCAPFSNLSFWISSGGGGGQIINIYLENDASSTPPYQLPALPANTNWQQFTLPFGTLQAAGMTNLTRVTFQLTSHGSANPFYLDDIQLTAVQPALVHVNVDASQVLRVADARWFGLNTAVWDSYFDTTNTSAALAELGTQLLRFPGGSLSDIYHWATNSSWDAGQKTWAQWSSISGISFTNFIHIATNAGAQAIITVNYGMGTSNEAAAWVRCANITNHLGFKYWEIGNECYGTWETDSNAVPNDPYTYAVLAKNYMAQMRTADPTIKIGVVAVPGEDSYSNNATHFAVNPRTGTTHYGWTPVMLSTLKSLGAQPDFLIHHVYPEYGSDNDQILLLSSGNWPGDAADLRQQLSDYLGSGGTNVELLCTENNSDSGPEGKQSTSLVNGLYLADSLAQLMKTEFNSFIWWDLRNGSDYDGDFNSGLYGWRNYGDLGIINGPSTRHPVFYAFKLMQFFARPGDTILNATTDYALLTAYASRKADGSVALLVINKDRYATLTAQLALTNFLPWTNAFVRSYGIAQDEATRTNSAIPGAQDIATNHFAVSGTNLSAIFPPYSLTLLTIPPAAPKLAVLAAAGGQMVLQVQGQAKVRYVVQSSTNLSAWTVVATNTLAGNVWNLTNAASAVQFWRAVWLPLN